MKKCFEFFTFLVEVRKEDGTVESRWPMSELPDEDGTAKKLFNDLLERYDRDLENILGGADSLYKREGLWPWAIVLLNEEFRLAGHVASVRQKKSEITFTSYSIKISNYSVEELGVPPVSIIYIQSKRALEQAAKQSELFRAVWEQLGDRPEGQQWICIADSPSAEWVEQTSQNDDELFMKIFREDKAQSKNRAIVGIHIQGKIEKCIAQRYAEEHPLRKWGQGMSDFAYIYHITRDQPPQFIVNYVIGSIDKLLAIDTIRTCFHCRMKLLSFAAMICGDKLQEKAVAYKTHYEEEMCLYGTHSMAGDYDALLKELPSSAQPRNYWNEVKEAIERFF